MIGLVSLERYVAAIVLSVSCLAPGSSYAVQPDEVLADPVLEQRARALSENARAVRTSVVWRLCFPDTQTSCSALPWNDFQLVRSIGACSTISALSLIQSLNLEP